MPLYEVEDQPDLTLPEDTIFRARLKEVKLHTFTWTAKKDDPGRNIRAGQQVEGETLQWFFEVTGAPRQYEDRIGRVIKGETQTRLTNHPNNRFHNWSEALLNRELPAGVGVDTDDLVGLSADISVRHRPDNKDPKKVWEEIDEVIPVGPTSVNDQVPF